MDKNVEIRTVVKFEAAHRQFKDPSKCGRLHGHNWVVDVTIIGDAGPLGYVVDFKDIKNAITSRFDHKVILHQDDPLVKILTDNDQAISTIELNPTCENLALVIQEILRDVIPGGNEDYGPGIQVKVWENDESFASTVGW